MYRNRIMRLMTLDVSKGVWLIFLFSHRLITERFVFCARNKWNHFYKSHSLDFRDDACYFIFIIIIIVYFILFIFFSFCGIGVREFASISLYAHGTVYNIYVVQTNICQIKKSTSELEKKKNNKNMINSSFHSFINNNTFTRSKTIIFVFLSLYFRL